MTIKASFLATAAILLCVSTQLDAQEGSGMPARDTVYVVVAPEKSVAAAAILESVVPTAGYAYAGDWSRGIPLGLVRIVGIGFMLSELFQFDMWGTEDETCESLCIVGASMYYAGSILATIDAGATASRMNAKHRASLIGATVYPTVRQGKAALAVRVPFGAR